MFKEYVKFKCGDLKNLKVWSLLTWKRKESEKRKRKRKKSRKKIKEKKEKKK